MMKQNIITVYKVVHVNYTSKIENAETQIRESFSKNVAQSKAGKKNIKKTNGHMQNNHM